MCMGVREVAHHFRALLAVAEDPGSMPTSTRNLTVPGILMPSSDLCEHQAPMWCTYIHSGKTFI